MVFDERFLYSIIKVNLFKALSLFITTHPFQNKDKTMIEYKLGERLGFIKKSPHSPECVSSIAKRKKEKKNMA